MARSKRSHKVQTLLDRKIGTETVKGFCTPGYIRRVAYNKRYKLKRVIGNTASRRRYKAKRRRRAELSGKVNKVYHRMLKDTTRAKKAKRAKRIERAAAKELRFANAG